MQQARSFSLGWVELAFVALVAILAAACGDDGGTDAGGDAARPDAARADSRPPDAGGGG
jgi:hypothetical protein